MRTADEGTQAHAVLEIARGEIGYAEEDGNITKYWEELHPEAQGGFWCGVFVSWCFLRADAPLPAIDTSYGFVNCDNCLQFFKPLERVFDEPEPGDIVLYPLGQPWPMHVGIVESVGDNGSFIAIEGNTSRDDGGSQDNGGEVCRRTRHVSQVSGFCRPDWKDPELKPDEREALFNVKAFVTDLQAAMTEQKEGRFPEPRIDRLEQEIATLSAQVCAIATKVGV